MKKRLHRTGVLSIALIQAVAGHVQAHAQFDLPPDTAEVGHLSPADPRLPVREEATIAFRRLDSYGSQMWGVLGAAHLHLSINGSDSKDEDVVIEEYIEVCLRAELWGEPIAGESVDLGLPVLFAADYKAHPMCVTGSQSYQTGISQVFEQAAAPPRRLDLQLPAVMLPDRAEMVAYGGSAAERIVWTLIAACTSSRDASPAGHHAP